MTTSSQSSRINDGNPWKKVSVEVEEQQPSSEMEEQQLCSENLYVSHDELKEQIKIMDSFHRQVHDSLAIIIKTLLRKEAEADKKYRAQEALVQKMSEDFDNKNSIAIQQKEELLLAKYTEIDELSKNNDVSYQQITQENGKLREELQQLNIAFQVRELEAEEQYKTYGIAMQKIMTGSELPKNPAYQKQIDELQVRGVEVKEPNKAPENVSNNLEQSALYNHEAQTLKNKQIFNKRKPKVFAYIHSLTERNSFSANKLYIVAFSLLCSSLYFLTLNRNSENPVIAQYMHSSKPVAIKNKISNMEKLTKKHVVIDKKQYINKLNFHNHEQNCDNYYKEVIKSKIFDVKLLK